MDKGFNNWEWKGDEPLTKNQFHKKKKMSRGKKKKQKKKQRIDELKCALPNDFYESREWRKVRYQVLRKYSGECMCCGRSKKHHGIVIHVDHIKPRSKYPHLALVFDNLQLLCEDCNLGKSNIDATDWRPD